MVTSVPQHFLLCCCSYLPSSQLSCLTAILLTSIPTTSSCLTTAFFTSSHITAAHNYHLAASHLLRSATLSAHIYPPRSFLSNRYPHHIFLSNCWHSSHLSTSVQNPPPNTVSVCSSSRLLTDCRSLLSALVFLCCGFRFHLGIVIYPATCSYSPLKNTKEHRDLSHNVGYLGGHVLVAKNRPRKFSECSHLLWVHFMGPFCGSILRSGKTIEQIVQEQHTD